MCREIHNEKYSYLATECIFASLFLKSDAARQAGRQIMKKEVDDDVVVVEKEEREPTDRARLELVLQEEEVVGGGDCDDIFCWVPGSVQDLLVEVQAVDVDLILLALAARAHLKVIVLKN